MKYELCVIPEFDSLQVEGQTRNGPLDSPSFLVSNNVRTLTSTLLDKSDFNHCSESV